MSSKTRKNLIRYGISIAICLAVAALYLAGQGSLSRLDRDDLYRVLSDAFFIPGFLTMAAGLMVALANGGALDGIGFVMGRMVRSLIPGGRLGKEENYGQYVERRRGKNVRGYGFLFVVGGVFLALGLIFTLLYMQAHG